MEQIPNELSSQFRTSQGRKELLERYGATKNLFVGINDEGEEVRLSFDSERGILCQVLQSNGWIMVAEYDTDGYCVACYYDGRWKESAP